MGVSRTRQKPRCGAHATPMCRSSPDVPAFCVTVPIGGLPGIRRKPRERPCRAVAQPGSASVWGAGPLPAKGQEIPHFRLCRAVTVTLARHSRARVESQGLRVAWQSRALDDNGAIRGLLQAPKCTVSSGTFHERPTPAHPNLGQRYAVDRTATARHASPLRLRRLAVDAHRWITHSQRSRMSAAARKDAPLRRRAPSCSMRIQSRKMA